MRLHTISGIDRSGSLTDIYPVDRAKVYVSRCFPKCDQHQTYFPSCTRSDDSVDFICVEPLVGRQVWHQTERRHPILSVPYFLSLRSQYSHRTLSLAFTCNALCAAVSPFRQRASKNLIQGYIFNGYRRLSAHFAYWAVPASLGRHLQFLRTSPICMSLNHLWIRVCHLRMGEEP